ncbi:hypothetical protein GCM10018966_045510 [Streptomyces yanii]
MTGGDSGIGRAVALAFAREGADVLLTHLASEEEEAQETARLIEEAGRRAVTFPCDIRDEAQCRMLIETAVSEFGRIDVLVNNAAYQMSQPDGIMAISTDQFDRVVRTNLYGMFWLCKMALPHIPAGGSIINTTSVQAYKPSPHLLDYAMTKGAIVTFTQGLAQMLASDGIRVNAVAPGPCGRRSFPPRCPTSRNSGSRARSAGPRSRPRWPPPTYSWPRRTPPSSRAKS